MHIQQNFLRIVRKRTHLTQVDIASVLKTSDFANVSRWEKGQKIPNIEIVLAYHLLFDLPIETLFERQMGAVRETLIPRIKDRMDYLESLPPDLKVRGRIETLGTILTRLTS